MLWWVSQYCQLYIVKTTRLNCYRRQVIDSRCNVKSCLSVNSAMPSWVLCYFLGTWCLSFHRMAAELESCFLQIATPINRYVRKAFLHVWRFLRLKYWKKSMRWITWYIQVSPSISFIENYKERVYWYPKYTIWKVRNLINSNANTWLTAWKEFLLVYFVLYSDWTWICKVNLCVQSK